MLFIFMSTNLLSHILHRVHPVSLNGGLLEGDFIITWLYVGIQGVNEVGDIFWRGIGSLFMVDNIGLQISLFMEEDLFQTKTSPTLSFSGM